MTGIHSAARLMSFSAKLIHLFVIVGGWSQVARGGRPWDSTPPASHRRSRPSAMLRWVCAARGKVDKGWRRQENTRGPGKTLVPQLAPPSSIGPFSDPYHRLGEIAYTGSLSLRYIFDRTVPRHAQEQLGQELLRGIDFHCAHFLHIHFASRTVRLARPL